MACSRDLMMHSITACPICREPRGTTWGELDAFTATREEFVEQEQEALRQMRRRQPYERHYDRDILTNDDIIVWLVERERRRQHVLWQQHQSERCGIFEALLACISVRPPSRPLASDETRRSSHGSSARL